MSKNSKDILIAFICLILAAIFLILVIPGQIPLPKFSSGGTTPRAIPKVCCWLMIVMAAIMLIRSFIQDKNCFIRFAQEMSKSLKQINFGALSHVGIVYGLSVVYYWGYCTIGFFASTLVLFPFYAVALGCRKPHVIILTDVILTFVVYYFFAVFMNCYLPGWAPF